MDRTLIHRELPADTDAVSPSRSGTLSVQISVDQ
jgi:hypothetical protein